MAPARQAVPGVAVIAEDGSGIMLSDIDDIDKLGCAERELAMRERFYPRWVESGKMRANKAIREIAVMAAIVMDYRDAVAQRQKEGK